MRKLFILLGLAAVLLCGSASAQNRKFGLGIMLGEPTGLSAKLWIGKNTAIDGALAWSFGSIGAFGYQGALYVHADYLFHNFNLIKVEKGRLPVYYGIGASVVLASSVGVGIRIPIGLEYVFADAPFDIFLEIVPMLAVVSGTSFGVNAGLGARYFFK